MKQYQVIGLIGALAFACQSAPSDTDLINDLKKDVTYLAADQLEGRAIGTDGEVKAAEYLAERFSEIGISPKGTDGFFFRSLPFPSQAILMRRQSLEQMEKVSQAEM